MASEGDVVPFVPTQEDVVSTKLRTWQNHHPGNIFYAELISQYVEELQKIGNEGAAKHFHEFTERIVQTITVDRGGRFLKLKEGEANPKYCRLMKHKECVVKVLNGLKNAYTKHKKLPSLPRDPGQRAPGAKKGGANKKRKLNPIPPEMEPFPPAKRGPPPKNAPGQATKNKPAKFVKKKSTKPKKTKQKQSTVLTPKRLVRYEARIGGDQYVNPYALELISIVCNTPDAIAENKILETPTAKYPSADDEPDKERRIRLQLRHRYFAAKAVRIPVVEFSRQLLQVWGGTLLEIDEREGQHQEQEDTNDNKQTESTAEPLPQMIKEGFQETEAQPSNEASGMENNFAQASAEPILPGPCQDMVVTPAVATARSSDGDEGNYETATENSFHEAAKAKRDEDNGGKDDDDDDDDDSQGNNAHDSEIDSVESDIDGEDVDEEYRSDGNGDGEEAHSEASND